MNTLKRTLTLSTSILLISFISSPQANKLQMNAKTKLVRPSVVIPVSKTKEYIVPGTTIIGYAKRHGYHFAAEGDQRCQFMGAHWMVPSKVSCRLIGFWTKGKQKCNTLRKGWKIKSISLKGGFSWDRRPANTNKPFMRVKVNNRSTKVSTITMKTMTLIGPAGPYNKYQEAFNHCSDSSYR